MVLVRVQSALAEEGKLKLKKQNHLHQCMLLQLGSASLLRLARVKQHAKVKWNGSPSSMGTEAYDYKENTGSVTISSPHHEPMT